MATVDDPSRGATVPSPVLIHPQWQPVSAEHPCLVCWRPLPPHGPFGGGTPGKALPMCAVHTSFTLIACTDVHRPSPNARVSHEGVPYFLHIIDVVLSQEELPPLAEGESIYLAAFRELSAYVMLMGGTNDSHTNPSYSALRYALHCYGQQRGDVREPDPAVVARVLRALTLAHERNSTADIKALDKVARAYMSKHLPDAQQLPRMAPGERIRVMRLFRADITRGLASGHLDAVTCFVTCLQTWAPWWMPADRNAFVTNFRKWITDPANIVVRHGDPEDTAEAIIREGFRRLGMKPKDADNLFNADAQATRRNQPQS